MIYEDAAILAELPNPGVAMGHVELKAKKDVKSLSELELEEAMQLFWGASFAATAVFETLGAQGSNIIVHEGEALEMSVLARNMDDGLDIQWDPSPADRAELEATASTIKDAFWYVGKEDSKPVQSSDDSAPEEVNDDDEDMRIQHLRRGH